MKKDWQARLEAISQMDRELWKEGTVFAGLDEAGRGPLCGPVAAACVIMPPEPLLLYVDDSKQLTEKRREMLYEQMMKGNFIYGGNPVFRWMCSNVVVDVDPAGNIKPTKKRSTGKIDGVVATIMALDRCIRHEQQGSVYDDPDRGLLVF